MAQFDVHRNVGPHKDAVPFVVVVQSSLFDRYRRRVVVPLVRLRALPDARASGSRMNPNFRVKGIDVVLHPLDIVSAAIDKLGPKVASLAAEGQAITDALDELFTRSWD